MNTKSSRRIFIDLGGNKGQSITLFLDNYPGAEDFEIHTFEPNKILWETLGTFPAILHKEIAWTHDGEMDFFVAKQSVGSTVVQGKMSGKVDYLNPLKLPCIDFGKWIEQYEEDYLVVKMNIEGAEYDILRHMDESNTLKYMDKLYVQFHDNHKIEGFDVEKTNKLKEVLDRNKVNYISWGKGYAPFDK